MLIELNEIEIETLKKVLRSVKNSFTNASYDSTIEAYPTVSTCYLPTRAHIKALGTIENKISNKEKSFQDENINFKNC